MLSFSFFGLAVLAWIGRSLWKTRTRTVQNVPQHVFPRLSTPLSDLDRWLNKQIGPRPPGMPYGLWVGRLSDTVDPHLVAEAVAVHNRLRYDPVPLEPDLRERLRLLCRDLRASLR
jgi:hypothetical protein